MLTRARRVFVAPAAHACGSGLDLPIGDSVSVALDEAGDYYYECSLHPQTMRGKVTSASDRKKRR